MTLTGKHSTRRDRDQLWLICLLLTPWFANWLRRLNHQRCLQRTRQLEHALYGLHPQLTQTKPAGMVQIMPGRYLPTMQSTIKAQEQTQRNLHQAAAAKAAHAHMFAPQQDLPRRPCVCGGTTVTNTLRPDFYKDDIVVATRCERCGFSYHTNIYWNKNHSHAQLQHQLQHHMARAEQEMRRREPQLKHQALGAQARYATPGRLAQPVEHQPDMLEAASSNLAPPTPSDP